MCADTEGGTNCQFSANRVVYTAPLNLVSVGQRGYGYLLKIRHRPRYEKQGIVTIIESFKVLTRTLRKYKVFLSNMITLAWLPVLHCIY